MFRKRSIKLRVMHVIAFRTRLDRDRAITIPEGIYRGVMRKGQGLPDAEYRIALTAGQIRSIVGDPNYTYQADFEIDVTQFVKSGDIKVLR